MDADPAPSTRAGHVWTGDGLFFGKRTDRNSSQGRQELPVRDPSEKALGTVAVPRLIERWLEQARS